MIVSSKHWPPGDLSKHANNYNKYTIFVFLYVIAFTAFSSAPIIRRVSPDQYNVRQVKYPLCSGSLTTLFNKYFINCYSQNWALLSPYKKL
jgi:hypothetical protein